MYRYYGIMTANKYGIDICVEHKPIYRIANLCTVQYCTGTVLLFRYTGMVCTSMHCVVPAMHLVATMSVFVIVLQTSSVEP